MARERPLAILDPLRRLISRQTGSSLTDTQLLDNFVTRRDEASFEVLVWRHGAMVLSVCKRVLRDGHEAEDAFQATFLVFARKAGSVGRGEVVAAWLYKVAYRIALRLRASAVKRASGEATDELPAPEAADDADWHDLRPVLDDEIARLPEKYRVPFVLCHLEGLTNEEAAAQLGCPKGTVLSRLSRGRERLRDRLARRGVALTATALALTLSQNAASASVPASLVTPTAGAAIPFATGKAAAELVPAHVAALTEGVLKTMTLIKVKITAAVLALAVLGTGITWAAGTVPGDAPARSESPVVAALPAVETEAAEGQRDRPAPAAPALTGVVAEVAKDGRSFSVGTPATERDGEPKRTTVRFGDKCIVTYNGIGANGAKPTVGYSAQVWFEANSKDVATAVTFNGPENARPGAGDFGGQVAAVAKDGKSLTLDLPPRSVRGPGGTEVKQITIPFDDKTVLAFSNVAKDGATLTVGHSARVWWADDGKTAAKVQFVGTAEPGRRDEKAPDVAGRVVRGTPEGKAIAIEVAPAERGGEPQREVIAIEKATAIFNNVPLDGAKVGPGLSVRLWLADDAKQGAAKVVFGGTVPERWTFVSGKVAAVAKDGNSFTVEQPATVRGEEPKRTEIKVNATTKLAFFGVGPDEAKIAEGMTAQARLLDGSANAAAQVTFGKPGERGR